MMQKIDRKNIISRLYSKNSRMILVLLQLLLLYIPNVMLFSIQTDNGIIPASLCYFFAVVFVPYFLANLRSLKRPPVYMLLFFVFVFVFALVRVQRYGLSKSILHWAFALYIWLLIPNVGHDFTKDDWLRLLETGACVFLLMHMVLVLINADMYTQLLKGYFDGSGNGYYTALLPSLTRGGRNLDATWLALGAFFVRGKKKAFYVTYVLLFSFVGSSRVGIIAIGLVILWSLLYDPIYHLTFKNLPWYALYGVVVLAILICAGWVQGLFSRFGLHLPAPVKMFGLISDQQAAELATNLRSTSFLSGREAIWSLVPQAFRDNPMGYGVGNAMRVLKSEYGFASYEDVAHNVLLQFMLDEGIVGLVWFVGIVVLFLSSQWKLRPRFFEKPVAAFFFTYLVLALVQFHGGEALMHIVMAIGVCCPALLYAQEENTAPALAAQADK